MTQPTHDHLNQANLDAALAQRAAWRQRYLVLKSQPEVPDTLLDLGELFQEMRLFQSAATYYQRVLAQVPDHTAALAGLQKTLPPAEALQAQARIPQTGPCVSIVMLTYNQWAYTEACLADLWPSTPEMEELILIDNASADETPHKLEAFAQRDPERIKVILNPSNRGFAGGCNQGLALATSDYILLLNNDVLFTQGWLGRLLYALEQHQLDIVAPMASNISGFQAAVDIPSEMLSEAVVRQEYALQRGLAMGGQIQNVHRLAGTCVLLRRRVIEKIGGFDDSFGPGNFEDDDFCYRALLAGFKLGIAKDSFLHHFGGKSFEVLPQNVQQLKENNAQIFLDKWQMSGPWPSSYLKTPFPEIISRPWDPSLYIPLQPDA